jgi:hypothetical protein
MKENLNQKAAALIDEIVIYDNKIQEEINLIKYQITEKKQQTEVLQNELKELDKTFAKFQEKAFLNYRAKAILTDITKIQQ